MVYFPFFSGTRKACPKPMPAETTDILTSPTGIPVWMIAKSYGPKKGIAYAAASKSLISQTASISKCFLNRFVSICQERLFNLQVPSMT
jgi:hypothetical protein